MKILKAFIGLCLVGAGFGWWLTGPDHLPENATAGLVGDPVKGEQVFWAAGCASCHMAPGAKDDAQKLLSGGQKFPSDFGTFIAPNISPDPQHGIGGWSLAQFADAVMRGVSPDGRHYYPVFPYTDYAKMEMQDLADMKAFMDRLPPSTEPSKPHEVGFPFNIRRSLGGWKLLFANKGWVVTGELTPQQTRGRYLVEAMSHCGQCHTPRNILGGLSLSKWLGGAPNPAGGRIPNITPGALTWSEEEIAGYLRTGYTPDYDSVGGHMAHVVENYGRLPESDAKAVAAYLKLVPVVK